MNPGQEIAKRRERLVAEIGQLTYERYDLCKKIEHAEERIMEVDGVIATKEAMLSENEHARRDFDTYIAIQESAVTTDQLKESLETGKPLDVSGAVQNKKGDNNA